MANSYKWWICVVCGDDYYTYYDGVEVVKARGVNEAMDKALRKRGKYDCRSSYVYDVFGPFNEEPQQQEV